MQKLASRLVLSLVIGTVATLVLIGALAALVFLIVEATQNGTSIRTSLNQDMYVIVHAARTGTIMSAASGQEFSLMVNGKPSVSSHIQNPRPVGVSYTDYPVYNISDPVEISDGDKITLAGGGLVTVQFDNSDGTVIQNKFYASFPVFVLSRFAPGNPTVGVLYLILFLAIFSALLVITNRSTHPAS